MSSIIKVKLTTTGHIGFLIREIDEDTYLVRLEEIDTELTLPRTDVEIITAEKEGVEVDAEKKYTGLFLAYETLFDKKGLPERYKIYLVNDLDSDLVYEINFYLKNEKEETWSGQCFKQALSPLGEMFYAELNESPVLDIRLVKIATDDTLGEYEKMLRIKPRTFFKTQLFIPIIEKKMHGYLLFDKLSEPIHKEKIDLRQYPMRKAKNYFRTHQRSSYFSMNNPVEFASFNPEIDLHVEALGINPHGLSNSEIIIEQLRAFEQFLSKAIRLGTPKIYVIHGVGKGRLRTEVHRVLSAHPDVSDYKNEYHPRYGVGATEVNL